MAGLTEEEIINNTITNGVMEVLQYEPIPKGAERARVTLSRYTWMGYVVEVATTYINPVTHHAIYDIQTQSKTLL